MSSPERHPFVTVRVKPEQVELAEDVDGRSVDERRIRGRRAEHRGGAKVAAQGETERRCDDAGQSELLAVQQGCACEGSRESAPAPRVAAHRNC